MSPGITALTNAISISARLARFAGARLIHDEAVGLDRGRRTVLCRAHPPIRYDVVSLDIGSTPRSDDVPGAAEHTIAVKPIDHFAARWEALLARAGEDAAAAAGVVGGGAGGVELALSAQHRLARPAGDAARGHAGHPRGAAAVAQCAGSAACFERILARARHPRRRPAAPSCGSSPAR